MTMADIIVMFRAENPEITTKKVSDATLKAWCLPVDKEVCAISRCIVDNFTIDALETDSIYETRYDLPAQKSKFYDIDDFPGGGVSFDNVPLTKTTIAELDAETPSWRKRTAGKPRKYYRRGKYLYFDYPVASAYVDDEIRVYAVLISDNFDNDSQTPYNQLAYLEPFHYGVVKGLKWKAKESIGKPQEAEKAQQEFYAYAQWMKTMITGGKVGPIKMTPKIGYYK